MTPGCEGTAAGEEGEEEGEEAEAEHGVARRPELVPGFCAVVQVFRNLQQRMLLRFLLHQVTRSQAPRPVSATPTATRRRLALQTAALSRE